MIFGDADVKDRIKLLRTTSHGPVSRQMLKDNAVRHPAGEVTTWIHRMDETDLYASLNTYLVDGRPKSQPLLAVQHQLQQT